MICIKYYNCEGRHLYEDVTVGVGRRGKGECVLILGGKWTLWIRNVTVVMDVRLLIGFRWIRTVIMLRCF